MVVHYGEIIMRVRYHSLFVYKIRQLMNDTPLRDPITPYYANSELLKFHDIVKLYTCLFLFMNIYLSNIITLHAVLPLNNC